MKKKLGAGFEAECDAHFVNMPQNYFLFRDTESVVSHIRQFREFFVQLSGNRAESGLNPLMRWTDHPGKGHSELTVACWDRHLLLARVAGSLAAENINILGADFYQRKDDLVLDVFRVCTQKLGPVTSKSARKRVEGRVFESFKELKFDFSEAIKERRKHEVKYEEVSDEIPQRVYVSNSISPEHTVVELQVVDRLGLLNDVFVAIGSMDFSVTHARINTEKGMAIDTIYVQTEDDRQIEDAAVLEKLEDTLCFVLFGKDRHGRVMKRKTAS